MRSARHRSSIGRPRRRARPGRARRARAARRRGRRRGAARSASSAQASARRDPLDARWRRCGRPCAQHVRAQRSGRSRHSASAALEVPLEVVEARDGAALGQQQPGAHARARPAAASRAPARAARSMRCARPPPPGTPASVSSRSVALRRARAGVSRSACSARAAASWRAPRAQARPAASGDRRRERRVGPVGREREVQGAQLLVGDHAGELACSARCSAPTSARLAAAASSGCDGAHALAVDDEHARVDGVARAASGSPIAASCETRRSRAQRDGQQQPAHRAGQLRDARAEQVLDRRGHRDVLADRRAARCAASVRPTSSAKSGLPSVGLDDAPQDVAAAGSAPSRSESSRRVVAERERADRRRAVSVRSSSARSSAVAARDAARAGTRSARRSAAARRSASASRGSRSSHWTSSTATTSGSRGGQRAQGVEQADRDRVRLRRRARPVGGAEERDVERVRLLAAGARRARSPSTPSSRSISAANESCVSAPLGRAVSTRRPRCHGQLGGGLPERRLADARAALEHERLAAAGDAARTRAAARARPHGRRSRRAPQSHSARPSQYHSAGCGATARGRVRRRGSPACPAYAWHGGRRARRRPAPGRSLLLDQQPQRSRPPAGRPGARGSFGSARP